MPLPNWGNLEKSQTDPEKIEEAIERMIRDHNNDPNAHLEEGQSLQSHRAAEIIDHRARSVLRDKLAFDRFQIETYFESLEGYEKYGYVELLSICQVEINSGPQQGDFSYVSIPATEQNENGAYSGHDPRFLTRVKFSTLVRKTAYLICGSIDDLCGFGFKNVNNNLYAVYWDDQKNEHIHQITGINLNVWHTYEARFTHNEKIEFLIDGNLVWTATENLPTGWFFNFFLWYLITTGNNPDGNMLIQYFIYDQAYFT
jgi:hypothetical protein